MTITLKSAFVFNLQYFILQVTKSDNTSTPLFIFIVEWKLRLTAEVSDNEVISAKLKIIAKLHLLRLISIFFMYTAFIVVGQTVEFSWRTN